MDPAPRSARPMVNAYGRRPPREGKCVRAQASDRKSRGDESMMPRGRQTLTYLSYAYAPPALRRRRGLAADL